MPAILAVGIVTVNGSIEPAANKAEPAVDLLLHAFRRSE
jgi:hypothetical protein